MKKFVETAYLVANTTTWVAIKDTERLLTKLKTKPFVISYILFFITFLTTTIAGCSMTGASYLTEPWAGLPFSIGIMTILLAHELGHYLMAKKYGVDASPPYFIPFPIGLGTLGAFISLRGRILNRKTLFDVGAWGPIAGLILTIPILLVGIATSSIEPVLEGAKTNSTSVWFQQPNVVTIAAIYATHWNDIAAAKAVATATGYTVVLNGMAIAGILGLIVTMINLFPIGQLDGGHIAHALLGYKKANIVGLGSIITMALLGVFVSSSFLIMLLFVFLMGGSKRKPLPHKMALGKDRTLIGIALGVVFLLCLPLPFL